MEEINGLKGWLYILLQMDKSDKVLSEIIRVETLILNGNNNNDNNMIISERDCYSY